MNILKKILSAIGFILLYVLLLLSLLPLVQWWAGLIALAGVGVLYGLKLFVFLNMNLKEKPYKRILRLLLWTVGFGVVAHLSCSAYSAIRMAGFSEDAHQEMEAVFKSLQQDIENEAKESGKTEP